jgi:hypothetical protein
MLQLVAAADTLIQIVRVDVTFDGATPTAVPIDVELWQQTGAGTSSALVAASDGPFHMDDRNEGVDFQTTGLKTFTAEPSSHDSCKGAFHVHPQTGIFWVPPSDIVISEAGRFGVRMLAPAAVNVDLDVYFNEC